MSGFTLNSLPLNSSRVVEPSGGASWNLKDGEKSKVRPKVTKPTKSGKVLVDSVIVHISGQTPEDQ